MAISLPEFPSFEINSEPTSLGQRWKKWMDRFENLLVALDITDPKRKKALMLHYAGAGVQEVFETLPTLTVTDGDANDYVTAKDQLNTHFCPKQNIEYETYVFRQAKQRTGETLDQYHTRLRQLAQTCDFSDIDCEV